MAVAGVSDVAEISSRAVPCTYTLLYNCRYEMLEELVSRAVRRAASDADAAAAAAAFGGAAAAAAAIEATTGRASIAIDMLRRAAISISLVHGGHGVDSILRKVNELARQLRPAAPAAAAAARTVGGVGGAAASADNDGGAFADGDGVAWEDAVPAFPAEQVRDLLLQPQRARDLGGGLVRDGATAVQRRYGAAGSGAREGGTAAASSQRPSERIEEVTSKLETFRAEATLARPRFGFGVGIWVRVRVRVRGRAQGAS